MKTFRERNVAGNYDAYVAGWRFNGKLDVASIFGSKARASRGLERGRLPVRGSGSPASRRSAPPPTGARAKDAYAKFARRIHEDQPYTFLYEGSASRPSARACAT